jgi:hypothetical protein
MNGTDKPLVWLKAKSRHRSDPMKASKRMKLEAAGWTVGSASDFLGLSKEKRSLR